MRSFWFISSYRTDTTSYRYRRLVQKNYRTSLDFCSRVKVADISCVQVVRSQSNGLSQPVKKSHFATGDDKLDGPEFSTPIRAKMAKSGVKIEITPAIHYRETEKRISLETSLVTSNQSKIHINPLGKVNWMDRNFRPQ